MEDTVSSLSHQFSHCQMADLLCRLHRDTDTSSYSPSSVPDKIAGQISSVSFRELLRTCKVSESVVHASLGRLMQTSQTCTCLFNNVITYLYLLLYLQKKKKTSSE